LLVPVPPVQAAEAVGEKIVDVVGYIIINIDEIAPDALKPVSIFKIILDIKHVPFPL
jgi:hypothetical protein